MVTQVGRLSKKKTARASTRLIENELLAVRWVRVERGVAKGRGLPSLGKKSSARRSLVKNSKYFARVSLYLFLHDKVDKLYGFLYLKFDNQKIIL